MRAGIQDIDDLVGAFNAAEDANYTLFNYVNEVNTEVETLEDNIGKVRQEIEAYMAQVIFMAYTLLSATTPHQAAGQLLHAVD